MNIQKEGCCFNPRSREGNDSRVTEKGNEEDVSIHVPAKGTTPWRLKLRPESTVSIHVPAKGTTDLTAYAAIKNAVSIHVPAKGTTGRSMPWPYQ